MGLYDGLNSMAAEEACRRWNFDRDTARRTASGTIARPEALAGPEADTVRTPGSVRAETGDQATGLVETAATAHDTRGMLGRAWASVTGRFGRPGTAGEDSDK